jgi:serine protease Do
MKRLVCCAAALLTLAWIAAAPAIAAQDLVHLIKETKPGVVFIKTYDAAGKAVGSGSGFFISADGQVITNFHVLAGRSGAVVKTFDGRVLRITNVLAADKTHDLIRVAVDLQHPVQPSAGEPLRPLRLAVRPPQVGERVMVIGNPKGLEMSVSDGIVSALRTHRRYGQVIQHTAPMSPGSSGGPLFNMEGRVIGVCTFHKLGGQNLNFAVSASAIAGLHPTMKLPLAQFGASTLGDRQQMDQHKMPPSPR